MEAIGLTLNEISYGALLNRFCREQKLDAAENLVEKIRKNGVLVDYKIYTILIEGYCKNGQIYEVFVCLLAKMFKAH